MLKGDCFSCGRRIQKTTADTCMYCGADLEPTQRFTPEEKQEILEEKRKLEEKLKANDQAGSKIPTGSALFSGGDVGGGDC